MIIKKLNFCIYITVFKLLLKPCDYCVILYIQKKSKHFCLLFFILLINAMFTR